MENNRPLEAGTILRFWSPMAATWLMMALEGPFLAAIIARLPDPKFNLAAWGVAFAFAMLVESPVIMMMSASTALVEDAHTLSRLYRFSQALNLATTALMIALLFPPLFDLIVRRLVGLPEGVAALTYWALAILIPWPGAIGYRRFYQGLMIRAGRTRLVALGTVVRLVTMSSTALSLFLFTGVPGACLGALALSAGVSAEALASHLMARPLVARLRRRSAGTGESLDYPRIVRFYTPLALTSLIGLAVQPMVTFFMGRARFPVESLAVLPVVNSLSFLFRATGLSFQEVGIALVGERHQHARELARFALVLGVSASAALTLIGFTPLATLWFETISGLGHELARFAVFPTRIMAPTPALTVLLCFQRALLVRGRRTRPITLATTAEVTTILLLLALLVGTSPLAGATAAALAFAAGRTASNLWLVGSSRRVLGRDT